MRRAGCRMVSFGIESGNPDILQKIHKKISLLAARQAIDACFRAGLRSQCTFILGFPFDTQKTMADTLHFAQELSPTIAIFFALVPYPGTEMYQYLPESLRPHHAEQWQDFANMINNQGYLSLVPGLSAAELTKMTEQWHLRFYLRPRQLYRMFRTLHTWQEFMSFASSGWGLAQKVIPGALSCLIENFSRSSQSMKCLLIAPPFSNVYGNFKSMMKYGFLNPPLGLCYLSASLKKAGHQALVLDCEAQGLNIGKIFEIVQREKPDLIGLTATSPELANALDHCRRT